MYRTAIRSDGCLPLGEAAQSLGYVPGTPVDVIVTSAGSLIVRIDDSPVLDVAFKPLTGRAASQALRERRAG